MLKSKRAKFTIPPQVTYLNCSYMSPLLKVVEKEGIKAIRRKRNPSLIKPDDFFNQGELLRQEFAALINSTEANRCVIIPSVSYGLGSAVRNIDIKKNQNIVVVGEQFPSNFYPWQALADETGAQLKIISPPLDSEYRGKRWNERILDSIDSSTRVVAMANYHWADGTRFDLEKIRARTREVAALMIIDGTQSVGAVPFDVQKIQPDALVCAGYKWLLGPYSIGMAYYGYAFDGGKPIEESWMNRLNSEDFAGLVNYEKQYKEGALRFEVGEHSNFFLVPMMLKALQQLRKWGVGQIQEYCQHISAEAIDNLKAQGFIIEDEAWRASHLFGMRLPSGMELKKLKDSLTRHKVFVSYRGNAVRISPNVYNTPADFERLLKAIKKI